MRTVQYSASACVAVVFLIVTITARAGVYINPRFPIAGGKTEGRTVLSPPVITQVDECARHVYVESFVPKATVRVFLNGGTLIGTATPRFAFEAVPISHVLHTGDKLTATQSVNGSTSLHSTPATVVGALPATLNAPAVNPTLYACGRVVDVNNLFPGITVSVQDASAGNAAIGASFTPNNWGSHFAPVVTSSLIAAHQITATQSSCATPTSAPAPAQPVLADPSAILAPQLDPPIVGNDAITLHSLYIGADVQILNFAAGIGAGLANAADNWFPVTPIPASGSITATQGLCSTSPPSTPQTPVNTIPEPQLLAPICPNQPYASVRGSTIDATLVLFKNGIIVGYGGAAPGDVPLAIAPPSAFAVGDTVSVVQYIGSLISPFSNVVTVNCAAQNVVTQHNNNARQGAQLAEKILTPASVHSHGFGLLYERAVRGTLLAQPLYVHGVKINSKIKNVIYVATSEDVVYAFDADDTSPDTTVAATATGTGAGPPFSTVNVPESTKWLWRTSLGSPHVGDICDETDPNIVGITSTPVIDVGAATMYVVARVQGRSSGLGHDYLHALDITTGKVLRKAQVSATVTVGSGSDAAKIAFNDGCQRQRPGLLLQNGAVYLGYGTYNCDSNCADGDLYRGWVIGFNASDFSAAGAFTNSMSKSEGGMGVWASGNGLAGIDGAIFYQTGNDIPALAPLGDSFVKLQIGANSLTLASSYQPPLALDYSQGDTDLGSGGPMLLPNGKLIGGGKDGRFFVLSQGNLSATPMNFQAFFNSFHWGPGPYTPVPATPVWPTACNPLSGPVGQVANQGQPCFIDPSEYAKGEAYGANIHGGPVYWQNTPSHGFVYKMPEKDYLKAFEYDIGAGVVNTSFSAIANVRPAADGMPGGFSSISANGMRDGIVWTVVQQANGMWGPPTNALLVAHDAADLKKELWSNASDEVAFAKFNSPTIADGRVILPSFGLFQVYGLAAPGAPRRWLRDLPLQSAINRKWLNLGGAAGLLGAPTADLQREANGGLRQDFHTMISGGGYRRISVSPSTKIQLPMCDAHEIPVPAVAMASSIFASPRTGVHYVLGEIRREFLEAGGASQLGYPLTDEVPTPDGFGLMTRFEKGTVYWYPEHVAQIGEPKPPALPETR
jgi:hypothetical protein